MKNQDRIPLGWRIFHTVLFLYLGRAAGKVLLNRTLKSKAGSDLRWIKSDLKRFLAAVKLEMADLRPVAELEKLPYTGNRILVELSILTIAAYRVLCREGIDPADARAAIADTGWNIYASQLALASLPFRLTSRDPAVRLQRTVRLLLWFPFSASKAPGYEVKTWLKDGDIYTHFTHCPPQTFVRNLIAQQGDKGELQAFAESWCKYDWPGADIIAGDSQRGHYERTKTLSSGDKLCDMCWKGRANGTAFRS
ncbi:MAG: L-2-amino-thiazoline-4-carboxylic acid hydrolase [Alphaproteobacteria bacterium]|nr:L-2-amino-thiazoline-4-carboxylic acid hydrolase [Alphaproteobacteria bacterium]